MGFADQYFSKQKGLRPYIHSTPSEQLMYVVVIPAYCEPDLNDSLTSLWKCARPAGHIEVIIVINSSVNAGRQIKEINQKTIQHAHEWILIHDDPSFRFFIIDKQDIPVKYAGVGLARKTGMDEALYRFNQLNKKTGIILSFDADSLCDENYFTAIEDHYKGSPSTKGFNIYFEHPVTGKEFPEEVYIGIAGYELHLRYVNQFTRYTGFPYAFHTIGSCFGVRADIYAGQGGMNKRKAGEDFYFLHKIIPLGDFIDINNTRVVPSPRMSNRVPFGTGAAITKYLSGGKSLVTYHPDCFLMLHSFFINKEELYKQNSEVTRTFINKQLKPLKDYLNEINAIEALKEINENCGSLAAFVKRFFRWFNAFRIVQFLNYASRNYQQQISVRDAASSFLKLIPHLNHPETADEFDLLTIYRKLESSS
jgi:hypothetical protein